MVKVSLDYIAIEGYISRIYDKCNSKYIWFDICKNEKYQNNDNKEVITTSFFSAKINRDKVENNQLFEKGKQVVIKGIPKSYFDQSNFKQFYVLTLAISETAQIMNNCISKERGSHLIEYDYDGVMIWNGKRCEAIPPNEEVVKEMEELLNGL